MTARIILLNGPSSAGKSTLSRAVQDRADTPFLRFSLDILLFSGEVLPKRRDREGPFDWGSIRPRLFDGYYGCLLALGEAGNDLVIDIIIETDVQCRRLETVLAPFDVFFVGLHCDLVELERRERARGDRRIGDARRDLAFVHGFGPYDFEVDSGQPPDVNATLVLDAWRQRTGPRRFGRGSATGVNVGETDHRHGVGGTMTECEDTSRTP